LTKKSTPNSLRTRWGEGRRLEFIEFRLLWERTINRGELMEFFGISAQQASADLAKYMQIAPDNIAYDKRRKAYCATPQLTPALVTPDAQAYLQRLREQGEAGGAAGGSFMGWRAPVDVVRMPSRSIAPDVLMRLLWAMRDGVELQVRYQSMRRPSPTLRWIAPHAFAFDGLRWHARAWCHENHNYRDFVLSRILEVAAERPTEIDTTSDAWWHSFVEVVVRPRVGLTTGQRAAIESDFGMHGGRLVLRSRKALAFYLLRHLRLDRESDEPPAAQPLELVNSVDLIDVLAAGRKSSAISLGSPPSH
jgi:hypothetical protein